MDKKEIERKQRGKQEGVQQSETKEVVADVEGRKQREATGVRRREEGGDGAKMHSLSRRLRAPRRLTTVERSPIFSVAHVCQLQLNHSLSSVPSTDYPRCIYVLQRFSNVNELRVIFFPLTFGVHLSRTSLSPGMFMS
jgi:hypothetical protein